MKRLIKKFRRSENNETPVDASRITNETLEETRKEVLKSSRKFVYPIQKSKHRVVILSSLIGAAVLVAFVGFSLLSLYRYKSTSTFIYRVTQVVPFPVAKAGKSFVSYEDYLFEIRQYIHYFETQEKVIFLRSCS
jgi:hypothetical protein